MSDETLALEVRQLKKSFRSDSMLRRIDVLHGIDLSVRRGEVVGFLGPNGAGKTTTLKIVMGLIRPSSGEAKVFGSTVRDPATRARVGFLPEHPYFYDYLTVEEILRLAADLHGLGKSMRAQRMTWVVERVGLEQRLRTPLRKLSKGWLQRVGMAQALINDPDLLILDEPMSGLDPIGRRELRELIRSLADHGKTVCFSSHILSDAEMLCDRATVIVDGRIEHDGALGGVDASTTRPVEVVLAGISPDALPSTPSHVELRDEQVVARLDDGNEVTAFVGSAIEAGAKVVSVTPQHLGLEEIFERAVAAGRRTAS